MAMEVKKTKVKMNKCVYLGVSILDISKKLLYEFWYDYIKPKYQRSCTQRSCAQDKAKLCYFDTDSFIIYIKLKIFMKTLLMMLRNCLTHLTLTKMIKDRFQ